VISPGRVGAGALTLAAAVLKDSSSGRSPGGGRAGSGQKEVDGSSRRWVATAAAEYRELRRRYREQLRVREETRW
jgi:hypothetical protein